MLFQVTSLKQHPSFMSMCCLWLRSLIRSIASGEPGQLDGILKRHRLFEVYTSRHGHSAQRQEHMQVDVSVERGSRICRAQAGRRRPPGSGVAR